MFKHTQIKELIKDENKKDFAPSITFFVKNLKTGKNIPVQAKAVKNKPGNINRAADLTIEGTTYRFRRTELCLLMALMTYSPEAHHDDTYTSSFFKSKQKEIKKLDAQKEVDLKEGNKSVDFNFNFN